MHSRLLRDRLELTSQLAAEATKFRRAFQESPQEAWQSRLTYKSICFNLRMEGDSPVFLLSHETNPDKVTATFSSPQKAARAAVEYHRTHILSRPRYEIERQPFIGWEYELGFESDSPEEIVKAFRASTPAFEGGDLIIWDRHEHACAAYLHWKPEFDSYGELISRSSRQVYLDQEIAAAAQRLDQWEAQRECVSISRRMGL